MASLSQSCQHAVKAVSGGKAAQAKPSSGAAAAPVAASSTMPPMSPREQLVVLRQYCGGDYRALCSGVPLGGGRAIACLRTHAGSLSPRCGEALSTARGNR